MGRTDVIAVIGAVTGTTGAFLGVLSYRRDRARTMLRASATWGRGPLHDSFFLHVDVVNAGRHPVRIIHVKVLHARWPALGRPLRLARFARWRTFIARVAGIDEVATPLAGYEPDVPLEPSEQTSFTLRAKDFRPRARGRPGRFTYVFAADTLNRVVTKRVRMKGCADSWVED
jgi:hypothetical protein